MAEAKTGKLKHSNLVKTKHRYFYAGPTGLLTYRRRHNGKSVKIATGKSKITEAKAVVDDKLAVILGLNPEVEKLKKQGVKNIPIKVIWNECIDERRPIVAADTLIKYDVAWRNHIEPFWGEKNILDLTEQNIRAWEAWFMTEKPGRVFFNTRKYFGMLLRFAHKRGHIREALEITELDKYIDGRAKRESAWRVYTEDELNLMKWTKGHEVGRLGMLLGSTMGMRISEFLSIEWKRVNFKKNYIEVWSKNNHWRKIPMPSLVAKELKSLRDVRQDSVLVFPMATDPTRPMSKQVYYEAWNALKEAAGITGRARVHDLRHTFATRTARDNWPPTVACKLLDMSLQQYMKTYVHITFDDMATMMERSFGGVA